MIGDSLQKAFNYSDQFMRNFTFPKAGTCNDYLQAENFEGDPRRYNFTAEQRYYIRNIQKISLTVPIGHGGRELSVTKQLRKPI